MLGPSCEIASVSGPTDWPSKEPVCAQGEKPIAGADVVGGVLFQLGDEQGRLPCINPNRTLSGEGNRVWECGGSSAPCPDPPSSANSGLRVWQVSFVSRGIRDQEKGKGQDQQLLCSATSLRHDGNLICDHTQSLVSSAWPCPWPSPIHERTPVRYMDHLIQEFMLK